MRRLHALLPLLALLFACVPARAQENAITPQGTHAFRALLKSRFGVQPLTEFEFHQRVARGELGKVLVVVLGNPSFFTQFKTRNLHSLQSEGAALLIATDRPTPDVLERACGARVAGRFYGVPATSPTAYRGEADCPLVTDFAQRAPFPVAGLRLATNRPSFLYLRETEARPFAWLPGEAFPEGERPRRANQQGPALAAFQERGHGRLIVLADHSVFINDMLLQTDNDNLDFAYRCANWLTNGGVRKEVLFIDDGQVETNFNLSLREAPPLPLPSESQLIQAADQVLTRLDEQGFFEQLIPDRARLPLVRVLVILGTLVLVFFGLRRLSLGRHRIERQDPLFAVATQQLAPVGTVMQRRHSDLQQQNNYWEMARQLARQCFPTAAANAALGLTITGSSWRRYTLGRRVRRLWHLASSEVPEKISARQLQRLREQVQSVQQSLADGSIRLSDKASGGR